MKIAVSASSPDFGASVDPRFGRCPYFLFVDPETMEFEAVENPNISSASGAGIQSAQLIANKGARALLTGSCGPNAFQTLQAAGVEVIVGVMGSIKEAVEQYKAGKFQPITQPNVPSHFGLGGSGAMGPGFGMGRGMGQGMGRGMGRGMGKSGGSGSGRRMGYQEPFENPISPSFETNKPPLSPPEELELLKRQSANLRHQMDNISKRIEDIEKKNK
jgi:predicted Fe-Mo cluster-binding NifX family protein